MRLRTIPTTLAALLAMATVAAAGVITISDSDFDDADWTEIVTSLVGGGSSHSEGQVLSGGNPGAYRTMAHTLGGGSPSRVAVMHIYTAQGYDPSTFDSFDGLTFYQDRIKTSGSGAIGSAFGIMQDGSLWILPSDSFSNTGWATVSQSTTDPSDFLGSGTPDFSPGGSPIYFGYFRDNTSSGSVTLVHGVDNWSVDITATPEPASLLLLGVGLGVMGLCWRRRRRRNAESAAGS